MHSSGDPEGSHMIRTRGLVGSGKEQVMKAFFIMIEHALEEYYESFKN